MLDEMLMDILRTQSVSNQTKRMRGVIKKYAHQFGCSVFSHEGNVYVTKGESNLYPCMVAHTDTVHAIVPDNQYEVHEFDNKLLAFNPVKNDFTGVGGDDKVGIYIALCALRDFPVMKAAFFTDEEIGCIGSGKAKMDFFKDCTLALQCDRKGNDDFIMYAGGTELYSEAFSAAVAPIIKDYGYAEEYGMMTDVMQLKENGLDICCANMSCGYYNPHSKDEFIEIDDMYNCMAMVYDILQKLGNTKWEHTFTKLAYTYSPKGYSSYASYPRQSGLWAEYPEYGHDAWDDFYPEPVDKKDKKSKDKDWIESLEEAPICPNCGTSHEVLIDDFIEMYYCFSCYEYLPKHLQPSNQSKFTGDERIF